MSHMKWTRPPGATMPYENVEFIVGHCTATRPGWDLSIQDVHRMHRRRGFSCGYHGLIRRDGTYELGRPLNRSGAHVRAWNRRTVGIALAGGVNRRGKPEMNFRDVQLETLVKVVDYLQLVFPDAEVLGHRDLSPDLDGDGVIRRNEWLKACPCIDLRHFLENGEALFMLPEAA